MSNCLEIKLYKVFRNITDNIIVRLIKIPIMTLCLGYRWSYTSGFLSSALRLFVDPMTELRRKISGKTCDLVLLLYIQQPNGSLLSNE